MKSETPTQPLRLVGICKNCKRPSFGFLAGGVGPFLCYQCATRVKSARQESTFGPWSFTFTTSTSDSTSNWFQDYGIGGS